ncbi:MAG TPA: tannase/feruloyl esterase family alpha/beta hydrolase [Vicinamibacterales bacterium]|nr:tannase/feruloyl esterase family alpha/beta hydrolase [Vicinamibacterales bacterium]
MLRISAAVFLVTLIAPTRQQTAPATLPDAGTSSAAERCAAVSALRLPDLRVTDARYAPADKAATGPVHVAHCRATGVVGTEIGFSVWLPDDWNGRFLMVGGGGFVGSIPGPGTAVDRGFAVTSTDTGHTNQGIDARWATGNMERQVNYAYLAVHRTAVTAKFIVRKYYTRDAHHAYFVGCSTGGRQGLMEAQRFPDDFDGVVSGAPVFDWTRVLSAGLKNAQAAFPDPGTLAHPVITADSLQLLQAHVLKACDGTDGVVDGVIDDPRACRFDLATVPSCPRDAAGPECLTRAQRTVIQRIYAPLTDEHGVVYEGQPLGGEAAPGGWQTWLTGPNDRAFAAAGQPALGWGFSTEFFKYFVFADPSWDYSRYDVAKSWRRDTKLWTSLINADNPNLSAFRARDGKLLLWHGWADPALNPLATIRYYDEVMERDPRAAADVRLFMLPGVLHCAGGPGPDQFDKIDPIVEWVEHGTAPSTIVVTKAAAADQTARSRPVCAYPAKAVYKGAGSTDDANNYSCK